MGGRALTSVFVMTDVVGSTALWEDHVAGMGESLEQHDRIVGEALADSGGRVFKHTGDGMIAVFDDADAAVAGSLQAVDGLAAASWGETGPLEIRVSVHAGQVLERDGDFFGPPLNKTARINGVGHAGQVLVSDVVRQLMSEPVGVDLGEHQLRDLSEPIRLWQLDEGDHPPLRTLVKSRHNLPVMSTEFIGRRDEIDELRNLLRVNRLVTITGVGGCGKTRAAVEAAAASADAFVGGVWFVDFTAERDAAAVGPRALGAMGLAQPLSGDYADSLAALAEATRGSATLLVLDNCEHLIDDVAEFAERVLAEAPAVTMLATSREALSVDGERVWRIPNLHDAAVELFLDRAAGVGVTDLGNQLDVIEQICAALDDIPLAIELAAAHVVSLPLGDLLVRLDDRFALLGGGRRSGRRRQRQQTLQAMMDWSYGLLSDEEQQLLRELSVFAGSFSLVGVEAVATASPTPVLTRLQSLVQQSLVVPLRDSGRYRLLETVRLYALDKLAEVDAVGVIRGRHLSWVSESFGLTATAQTRDAEALVFEDRQWAEVENAIAAMGWAEETGDAEALFGVFVGFEGVWQGDNRYAHVGLSWLERIPIPATTDPLARVRWLVNSGLIHFNLVDLDTAFEAFLEGAVFVDELRTGDPDHFALWSPVVFFQANIHAAMGDYDAALASADLLADLASESPTHQAWLMWMSYSARGLVAALQGDPSIELATNALKAIKGTSAWAETIATAGVADALLVDGQHEQALELARECLDAKRANEGVRIPMIATGAAACAALGRFDEALEIIGTDLGPMLDPQRRLQLRAQVTGLAAILAALGDSANLDRLASIALNLSPSIYDTLERMRWIQILRSERALADVPEPSPSDLELEHVSRLVAKATRDVQTLLASPR